MRFPDIRRILEGVEHHRGSGFDTTVIRHVTAGDLMSEVLVFDLEDLLLVTSLNSEQVLRTAHMIDAAGVVLVNDKVPNESMIALARSLDTTLLSSPRSMFEACVALNELLSEDASGE